MRVFLKGLIMVLALMLSATSTANAADAPQVAGDLAIVFVQQIYRCWLPPIRADGSKAIVVRLDVHLNIDGQVAEAPTLVDRLDTSDPLVHEAVSGATKAVYGCAPYKLPSAQYEKWKEIVVVFDPRSL